MLPIGLRDVEAAAARIAGRVRHTPLLPIEGTDLLAKCESFQITGSFKLRGATNAVLGLAPPGVVAASSGNHGRAVAFAARTQGIPAVVVMPRGSSPYKRAAIEALGARVVDSEPDTEDRDRVCREVAEAEGLTMVPPYDHPLTMAGQGTCGLEILEDIDPDAVVVPVGGGGLISGIATAIKARRPATRVIGVEPGDGDDYVRSRAAGTRITIPVPQTICDGARVQTPGQLTWPVIEALVDEVIAVPDDEVVAALRMLAAAGLAAEPTGGLAVAGALRLGLGPGTVCVVSGRNVSPAVLARYLAD